MSATWIKREGALRTRSPDVDDDVLLEVKHRDGTISKGYVTNFYWGNSFGDKDVMEYRILE